VRLWEPCLLDTLHAETKQRPSARCEREGVRSARRQRVATPPPTTTPRNAKAESKTSHRVRCTSPTNDNMTLLFRTSTLKKTGGIAVRHNSNHTRWFIKRTHERPRAGAPEKKKRQVSHHDADARATTDAYGWHPNFRNCRPCAPSLVMRQGFSHRVILSDRSPLSTP
jgi:hypothetical protein